MFYPLRHSSLKERNSFYKKEFPYQKLISWMQRNPQILALDAGSDTGIIRKREWKGTMFFFPMNELHKQIRKYVPEDIYYDRNIYDNPEKHLAHLDTRHFLSDANVLAQELVFDIDSDNIPCIHSKKEPACIICLSKAYEYSLKLKKKLLRRFRKIKLVYSGRGFHVHVLDDKAYRMSLKDRQELIQKFSRFPIDPWVSQGNIELIRLPFSLNSLVSRIVAPLDKDLWNPEIGIPEFLKING